jgi:hypothetical protein
MLKASLLEPFSGAGGGREVGGREQPLGVALPEHARDAAHLGGWGLRARGGATFCG